MVDVISRLEERTTRLIEELESSRVKLRQFETENDGLRITAADRDSMESETTRLAGRIAELENDLVLLKTERDGLLPERDRVRTLEVELAAARSRIEEQAVQLHTEMESARAEAENTRNELRQAQAAIASAEVLAATHAAAVEASAKEVEELRWYLGEREAEVESLKAGAADGTMAASPDLSSELGLANAALAESQAMLDAIEDHGTAMTALRQENEELRLRLNESTARDARTRERLGTLLDRIEKAEQLIEQMELSTHGTTTA